MAEVKNTRGAFVAKANVNFSINVNRYGVVRARNEAMLAELRLYEPLATLPSWTLYHQLSKDQQIKVGETIELNEANNVVQIPFELFDMYADAKVEQPCSMRGNVEEGFEKMVAPMPEDMRQEFTRKEGKMKERFIFTPMMSRV